MTIGIYKKTRKHFSYWRYFHPIFFFIFLFFSNFFVNVLLLIIIIVVSNL